MMRADEDASGASISCRLPHKTTAHADERYSCGCRSLELPGGEYQQEAAQQDNLKQQSAGEQHGTGQQSRITMLRRHPPCGCRTASPTQNTAPSRHSNAVPHKPKIPDRGHALTIDNGWRVVADTALTFIARFI